MLFGAYLLFAFVLAAALDDARGGRLVARNVGLARGATAALAAVIAAGAALRLNHVIDDPELSWPADRWAYILPATIGVGAVLYAIGGAFGDGAGLAFRSAGWLLMASALLLPSTLSLALPLVALLAVTLRRVPPRMHEPKTSTRTGDKSIASSG